MVILCDVLVVVGDPVLDSRRNQNHPGRGEVGPAKVVVVLEKKRELDYFAIHRFLRPALELESGRRAADQVADGPLALERGIDAVVIGTPPADSCYRRKLLKPRGFTNMQHQ